MKKLKINWKKLGLIGLTLSTITTVSLTPFYINSLNKSKIQTNQVYVAKDDIDFSSSLFQTIPEKTIELLIQEKEESRFYHSPEFEKDLKEASKNIADYTNAALNFIKVNGVTNDFFTTFVPDVNTKEVNEKQLEIFEENNDFSWYESLSIDSKINGNYNIFANYSFEDLKRLEKDLEEAHLGLSIAAGVAAAASAAFWVASWWFGITIPWATASAGVSIGLGTAALAVKIAHKKVLDTIQTIYDEGWVVGTIVLDAFMIGFSIVDLIKMIKVPLIVKIGGGQTIMSLSGWAVPTVVLTVTPIFLTVLTALDYFDII